MSCRAVRSVASSPSDRNFDLVEFRDSKLLGGAAGEAGELVQGGLTRVSPGQIHNHKKRLFWRPR